MQFNIADKLALIYTSAGSQRNVASIVSAYSDSGPISHQTIGRILHKGFNHERLDNYEIRADLQRAIDAAFQAHTDIARDQARVDGIPFTAALPVFSARPIKDDGATRKPLAVANHTHWLRDDIRNSWIKHSQKTRKYVSLTVGSQINIAQYAKQAMARDAMLRKEYGLHRNKTAEYYRQFIMAKGELAADPKESQTMRIYTPKIGMSGQGIFPDLTIADLEDKLNQRHSPAVGAAGTALADIIIMQFDHREKSKHAKRQKARGAKGRTSRRK